MLCYLIVFTMIHTEKKAISMSHIKPTAPQNMIEKEFPLDSKGLLLLFLLPRSLVRINLWKRTWYLWSFRARVILPPSCMYWCQTIYTQTNVLLPNKIYLPIHSISVVVKNMPNICNSCPEYMFLPNSQNFTIW